MSLNFGYRFNATTVILVNWTNYVSTKHRFYSLATYLKNYRSFEILCARAGLEVSDYCICHCVLSLHTISCLGAYIAVDGIYSLLEKKKTFHKN